ncbi:uncharacterized protein LOC115751205 [Rhodamnia argentea]|uniref:Uncharacterized protein LOC115751205 n=1 Tax=Rhodamnia argentea TaxID=178133 RepID=A0A8B8QE55_9MYRT|nr:uncharacterized protein LOC115751205 [Rhodamnia argentea]XP_030544829.1 uncharacterized protein LOC115751205 [Rhodamnia argentea]XP_048136410.1 uncharacterized protein LOC115751205 [Rhodamnia argentea]
MVSKTSLSLRLTFLLSLSLSASYSTCSHSFLSLRSSSSPSSSPSSPIPKATPSDLLSLLGPATAHSSSSVNPVIAGRLRSCFRFLVPFSPRTTSKCSSVNRKLIVGDGVQGRRAECERRRDEDRLIWWPPEPVLELARLAVDSGGDVGAIHRAIDPTPIAVPDVEGSKEDRCELTRAPYGRRFISEELNAYLKFLFELIESRGSAVGLDVTLSRYDFFHGHLFLANDTGRLGILFHAKEYPSYDKEVFPYYMGYCQTGSNVTYDDSMNLRNILWLAPLPSSSTNSWVSPGVLVVLDARPDGIIYQDLIPEYVQFARTLYEDDLGDVAVDVNYLNVGGLKPNYQIFIC